MKKKLILLILFITVMLFSMSIKKENELVFKFKGYGDKSMKRLEPVIFQSERALNGIVGINKDNCFVTLNKDDEFAMVEIFENGKVQIKAIADKFPGRDGDMIKSDSEHNVVWMTRGRGLYFLDINTKKTGHCIASADGNDKVLNSFLADPENKIFLFDIHQLTPVKGFFYVLYDLNKDEKIFKSNVYQGDTNLFLNNKLLFKDYITDSTFRWVLTDYNMKEKEENKLTKELTKLQMSIWPRSKTISVKRKLMLGVTGIKINDKYQYCSIRWDDEFKDIKIEPMILQKPKDRRLDSGYEFSPDSNWVKSLKYPDFNQAVKFPPELIIFPVGEIYPQWIGMPIHCGYTKEKNPGAFVNHTVMGPCYVEWDPEFPKKLFVYKLLDGMKILAEEAKSKFNQ